MKMVLLFFIAMVLVWQWRRARVPKVRRAAQAGKATMQPMVPCLHCGVHLPSTEAIQGRTGAYCSSAHRQAVEP